jgi:hypothetical protein
MNKNIIIGVLSVVVIVLLLMLVKSKVSLTGANAIITQDGRDLSGLSLTSQSILRQMYESQSESPLPVDTALIADIKAQHSMSSLVNENADSVPPGIYIECYDDYGGPSGEMSFSITDTRISLMDWWGYATDICEYKTQK